MYDLAISYGEILSCRPAARSFCLLNFERPRHWPWPPTPRKRNFDRRCGAWDGACGRDEEGRTTGHWRQAATEQENEGVHSIGQVQEWRGTVSKTRSLPLGFGRRTPGVSQWSLR